MADVEPVPLSTVWVHPLQPAHSDDLNVIVWLSVTVGRHHLHRLTRFSYQSDCATTTKHLCCMDVTRVVALSRRHPMPVVAPYW